MPWSWIAVVALSAVLSLVGTRAVLTYLRRHAILDHPNARSSHRVPTPRGGGLALIAVLVGIWAVITALAPDAPAGIWRVLAGAIVLAAIGWRDDRGGLPPLLRLIVQIGAVALGLSAFAGTGPVFQGLLPITLDRLAAGFLWLWFLNLFNFMDGIDGLTGGETVALGIGIAAVAAAMSAGHPLSLYGLAAAGAALGFLWWNWHPARVFMGDVGSVPLGYLLGWLLLALASHGFWMPALILPLYYLADATLTLLRRLLRGERVWEAHREHFYQRAVQAGLSHGAVVAVVLAAEAALIGLAAWPARTATWLVLPLAAGVVAALLAFLGRRRPH